MLVQIRLEDAVYIDRDAILEELVITNGIFMKNLMPPTWTIVKYLNMS